MAMKRKLSEVTEPEEQAQSSKRNCKFKNLFTILLSKMSGRSKRKEQISNEKVESPSKKTTTISPIRLLTGKSCANCELVQVQAKEDTDCNFCERYVCSGCVRICDRCMNFFCQFCSVKNYDAAQDRAFCHSCY